MGQTNAANGLRNLAEQGRIGIGPTASEQSRRKGLIDRFGSGGEEKARQLGIEMAKGGAGLVKGNFTKYLNAFEEQVNIKGAGQERKVRERKRTIFAGANMNNNIFRRTLGGL
jgi:hypothetical protein